MNFGVKTGSFDLDMSVLWAAEVLGDLCAACEGSPLDVEPSVVPQAGRLDECGC